jgi:hypothetical protein
MFTYVRGVTSKDVLYNTVPIVDIFSCASAFKMVDLILSVLTTKNKHTPKS